MKNLLFAGLLLILAVGIGWGAGQSQGALSGRAPRQHGACRGRATTGSDDYGRQ